MRTNPTFNKIYLALLLLELAVITYDGLFSDKTLGQWIRITILAVGAAGFYAWSRGLWLTWKWAWRLAFVLVCGWFLVYLPMEMYREWDLLKKAIDELGVSVIAPGYLVFFAFHIPLFYALYSAGFQDADDTTRQAAQRSHGA